MRNFPHQVNQIPKIKGAVRVARQLSVNREDVGDDGTFGYSLARAGIYTFRDLTAPTAHELDRAIRREQTKVHSNQGPRTFARDLRRTLSLLGFLERLQPLEPSVWRVTASGQRISEAPNLLDPEATATWTDAVLGLSLSDESGTTHPARNMLELVLRRPGVEKKWLAFVLDMRDESENELARVLALQQGSFEDALRLTGSSEYMAANAVKILPSLLEQLGLMSIQRGICTPTPSGMVLLRTTEEVPSGQEFSPRRSARRRAHSGKVIGTLDALPDAQSTAGRIRSTEEQLHSAALLDERTAEHQQIVRRVVNLLRSSGWASEVRISDDAFDVLAFGRLLPEIILIEAKTLRGDSLVQARIALGQLHFYEYFDVQHLAGGRTIRKIVAFDQDPHAQAKEFLDSYGVASLVSGATILRVPHGFEECFGRT